MRRTKASQLTIIFDFIKELNKLRRIM